MDERKRAMKDLFCRTNYVGKFNHIIDDNEDSIIRKINAIPNGQFFSICYKTDMTPYLKEKMEGFKLIKISRLTARTGIRYSEMQSTKERNAKDAAEGIERKTVKQNCEWIVANKVKYNFNTKKHYFRIAPKKDKKSWYILESNKGDCWEGLPEVIVKQLLKENNRPASVIKDIAFENLLAINNNLIEVYN